MQFLKITFIACLISLAFASCDSDEGSGETAVFAVPIVSSLAEIRNSISVSAARDTDSEGKIYVAEGLLFYIAKEEGVHVFNNQNPAAPQNIAFINIDGVHDIAIKDGYLYADNYVDMLVFDISDINIINLVDTIENVVSYYPAYPENVAYYDFSIVPGNNEIITGFRFETREKPLYEYSGGDILTANEAMNDAASNGDVGVGGSYAKFQINGNALYTIDNYQLNVFNIGDPEDAYFDKAIYLNMWLGGGQLETLFRQKEFLFVGATSGMYVVDATDEFNPVFISGFSHATACDPVVVNGNTAYITVRGGSSCGAIQDQVNVIDISDIGNPTLMSTYLLEQPYGLGVKGNTVYVCCGSGGLKVFDAENASGLELKQSYAENATDVIPLSSHLIVVGENKIIQYNYGDNFTLMPMSVLNF